MSAPLPFTGLLGGSFNPAHAGHVHISLEARKILGLKKIWWMVSPQNPLKSERGMAPFPERFAGAKAITRRQRFIRVSDIENRIHTRYTIDTLRKLRRRFPRLHFVWLMGADNLATIHRWQEWEQIFALVPVLVLDRSPFSHSALRKKAALRFAKYRKNPRALLACANQGLPVWAYTHMRRHPESSTAIRKNLENRQK
ncbi:MAG: nicotinate-nucleotide adenylyltransferase [Alphaproteobacteria bacterium]|nr:nicotinate-nucleotide adenylyltransferase [Alphaproteobacteria bacterium]